MLELGLLASTHNGMSLEGVHSQPRAMAAYLSCYALWGVREGERQLSTSGKGAAQATHSLCLAQQHP